MSFADCTEVSALCPVEATVLGYYPNLGSGVFFTIAFGLCMMASGVFGVWKRTWTYGVALTLGILLEALGYIGRILLNDNPWDKNAFQLQICTIILAPTLICAAIYLTLKHVALNLNPSLSRIPPSWYPRIFLPADLSCLILQAIGGGVAAAAGNDERHIVDIGNNIIIAGIVLQVIVLAAFGVSGIDYYLRVRKYFAAPNPDPTALAVWNNAKFRTFTYAVMGAYACVLIRCIYRIAEMSGGWGNHIMQDEISFLVLDPTLVTVAVYLLTVFHPGLYFPQMSNSRTVKPDATTETPVESSNEGTKEKESPVESSSDAPKAPDTTV